MKFEQPPVVETPRGKDEKKKKEIPPGIVEFPPGGTISAKKRSPPRGGNPGSYGSLLFHWVLLPFQLAYIYAFFSNESIPCISYRYIVYSTYDPTTQLCAIVTAGYLCRILSRLISREGEAQEDGINARRQPLAADSGHIGGNEKSIKTLDAR